MVQMLGTAGRGSACLFCFLKARLLLEGRETGAGGQVDCQARGGEEEGVWSRLGHPGSPEGLVCRTGTAPGTWEGEEAQAGRHPRRGAEPLTDPH